MSAEDLQAAHPSYGLMDGSSACVAAEIAAQSARQEQCGPTRTMATPDPAGQLACQLDDSMTLGPQVHASVNYMSAFATGDKPYCSWHW